jgi:hypothetical protein
MSGHQPFVKDGFPYYFASIFMCNSLCPLKNIKNNFYLLIVLFR